MEAHQADIIDLIGAGDRQKTGTDMQVDVRLCRCGHDETTHGVTEPGCNARCRCDLCPDDTGNDCWCAGFKPLPHPTDNPDTPK